MFCDHTSVFDDEARNHHRGVPGHPDVSKSSLALVSGAIAGEKSLNLIGEKEKAENAGMGRGTCENDETRPISAIH